MSAPLSLWKRLERRIGLKPLTPALMSAAEPAEPEWEEVAPGISCQPLATDLESGRVSMLVRMVPGARYPSHIHGDVEELYMLEGELTIDGKTLYAGDYLRSEPGTRDVHVWSESGCTGVLLTSMRDTLL